MKEADLQRLFHRPPVPTSSRTGPQESLAGRAPSCPLPAPPSSPEPPPPKDPVNSGSRPSRSRGGRRGRQAGAVQPFSPAINILGLGGATNSTLWRADRSGPQLPAFPPRAVKSGRSFFSVGAEGYAAPPPRRTLRGHRLEVDRCTGAGVPREGTGPSHTYSRPACPALLRIPNSASETTQRASESGKHLHRGGRRKPNPAPLQAASETHLPLPLAAGKLGAFMAPREEGSQAESHL
ncbi:proline-rich protein 36-like [Nomascus leucogenys]|uniref:proline-rich protein 36-like n=1 Tax=Nomascus leucogenys TaxID=61853 RepID=UPI00062A587C|nr:proline-rich protein 36-like [Nomascus leucogenys]